MEVYMIHNLHSFDYIVYLFKYVILLICVIEKHLLNLLSLLILLILPIDKKHCNV